jgi:hypothetical protein
MSIKLAGTFLALIVVSASALQAVEPTELTEPTRPRHRRLLDEASGGQAPQIKKSHYYSAKRIHSMRHDAKSKRDSRNK